ncbi:unnamed protein product [Cuscuta campestris]|uniref:C3H1-type domain-containing protein n=1 Tax=Cuscuta campestris TaxID=132261 RepID=A0A484NIJ6_9ASTE|nr:unnamed protein product [Cuscuta campestris]
MAFVYEEEENYTGESDADTYDSDDSINDPTFDILEDTQSKFSKISISKKTKSRVCVSDSNDGDTEGEDFSETHDKELGENDQNSYEKIQSMIQAGDVQKLKVDQCKIYLRKHRLRLTGNKATLIQRIKEHIDIVNGDGEKMYPVFSFVLNCKGDACTGDVVFFEQNVYETFNIASRSATGPLCGTRTIAGRIVKESYGMAKQQHTFTIEVLWSKGEKPLPPLHPLLIKGRNLYRLKTMRQRWEDEGQRQKNLEEKHRRGSVARAKREVRVEKKKMQQELKLNRMVKAECQKQTAAAENKENIKNESQKQDSMAKTKQDQAILHNERETNLPQPFYGGPNSFHVSRMPLHDSRLLPQGQYGSAQQPMTRSPLKTGQYTQRQPALSDANMTQYGSYRTPGNWHQNMNPSHRVGENFQAVSYHWNGYGGNVHPGTGGQRCHEKRRPCSYYAQGRCYYGHNCKYLH